MNILFVGNQSSVFVFRTAQVFNEHGHHVNIFDPKLSASSIYQKNRILPSVIGREIRLLVRIVRTTYAVLNLEKVDLVILHSFNRDLCWLAALLSTLSRRVVVVCYGSDVLQRSRQNDWAIRFGFKFISAIAATSSKVLDQAVSEFKLSGGLPSYVVKFGTRVFDSINELEARAYSREELLHFLKIKVDKDIHLVALGYSSSKSQRQLDLISTFKDCTRKDIIFLLPIQYGDPSNADEIQSTCEALNATHGFSKFIPLRDFLDDEMVAMLRLATSVLINHSITDSFSATVQETVYAGNVVIAGRHLPYNDMPGFGDSIQIFETTEECKALLYRVISGWQPSFHKARLSSLRQELDAISGWDAAMVTWSGLLEETY